jgi:rubrerythrin
MLRLRARQPGRFFEATARTLSVPLARDSLPPSAEQPSEIADPAAIGASALEIVRIFDDPLLELTRLLREAANIEHALMVQYLFAAFSVKDRYQDLAGGPVESSGALIGVAVQEMRHLARVNELLVALAAQPNLDREDFPIRTDVYPFALELEPLTRSSLAKYVTAESPLGALDPSTAPNEEERRFRNDVAAELGGAPVNHIGSLYGTIIARLQESLAADPNLLPNAAAELTLLQNIREQGEEGHFRFFRSVFEGKHPAFGGADVWKDPQADIYPSQPFSRNPSVFDGGPRTIQDPLARQIAWLADLHYWAVLGLLYLGHSAQDMSLIGQAISHMVGCVYPLGKLLATHGAGMPFDPIALNGGSGSDRDSSRSWLRRMLKELQKRESELGEVLPVEYSSLAAIRSIQALGGA